MRKRISSREIMYRMRAIGSIVDGTCCARARYAVRDRA